MNGLDIRDAIYREIELPAFERVRELIGTGQMAPADADRFRTAADAYKAALLSHYDDFDPLVRRELLHALFTDYRREIQRLLAEIEQQRAPGHDVAAKARERRAFSWLRGRSRSAQPSASAGTDPRATVPTVVVQPAPNTRPGEASPDVAADGAVGREMPTRAPALTMASPVRCGRCGTLQQVPFAALTFICVRCHQHLRRPNCGN